ncbi:hypothetical protein [Streptomyces sp. H39-S7]|uniref:hypothetical protein n=1 Tax=Streptomyces sp. H39-S7 TaxID=3004357 RepID=UPI0022B05B56|nr:hypothetical protein [Streptomyces sp. H39-S7]MCZ4121554.1 hypothetical protein [Streptomyces sp. H39-S7]
MKTTMLFRPIANPRRTTLMHLKDAEELQAPVIAAEDIIGDVLPQQTANPRRTILVDAPTV